MTSAIYPTESIFGHVQCSTYHLQARKENTTKLLVFVNTDAIFNWQFVMTR